MTNIDLEDVSFEMIDNMTQEELDEFIKYAEMQAHKKDKMQHATKILLNSLYGALGSFFFRFYNIQIAEAITLTGQCVTAESFGLFNDYLDKIENNKKDRIAFSDTDSAGVDMTDFVELMFKGKTDEEKLNGLTKLADTHFNKMLTDKFEAFAQSLNSYSNKIVMKREKIAQAIIIAKKNYVVLVYDNEGVRYSTPKLSVTGLESVKASTPKFFRSKLEAAYKLCFDLKESKLQDFIQSVKDELDLLSIDEVAGTTTVNNIEKYWIRDDLYRKGAPGHVRAAITYNNLIKDSEIYTRIKSGDKVKIVQLVEPNPVRQKSICYVDKFPEDLLDAKFIDRDQDYEKYYVKPISRVLDIFGWKHKFTASLSDLFG